MAVRGKERLKENNEERPSSDASSVSEVCSEAASDTLCERHRGRVNALDMYKKSEVPRCSRTPRRLSGDFDENHYVQNTVVHAERHSTV